MYIVSKHTRIYVLFKTCLLLFAFTFNDESMLFLYNSVTNSIDDCTCSIPVKT